MPARLVMDQQSAIGPQDLKKDRSHAQERKSQSQSPAVPLQSVSHTIEGAPNGVLPNGIPATSQLPLANNGEASTTMTAVAGPGSPPPLDQSWRQHESNKRLGLVIERLAQKCYRDLNTTITHMSEIEVEPQQHQANGIVPHAGEDTSEGSLRKKRLLMDFAKEQRDRFVKTLVLSDWCRNEEDQGKLIDIKVWQDREREAQVSAMRGIGQTKVNMIPAKVPNPNIEGAMELLATGRASWVPDLRYIPPKRLSAKQLLRTLRNMNVALATRLNLHEELPPHFHDFSIADGRATFTVKDEFEVDLSVADEEPATPFYFIDIRILFTPASNVLDDRLRGYLEAKANSELATKGLKGCYHFLHNFVITHKINVLRSQAMELIRGKWFDCIRPENMRRSFIVQYWASMPGPKSWLEFGVCSGKQRITGLRRAATSEILVRWFRRGVEVKDEVLEFDWRDLNLERCLSIVISKHTGWVLSDLQSRIRSLARPGSPVVAELTCVESAMDPSALSLSLPSLREPLKVRIEHITGQFSIVPPSPATLPTERRLNSDSSADVAKWLASLVCAVVQERVRKEAELLGWAQTPNLVKQDNLQRILGEGVRHISVFSPSRTWGNHWALAVTFGIGGENWWTVSLNKKRDEQDFVLGKVLASARRVSQSDAALIDNTVSRALLMRTESLAVAEVAFSALSEQLKEKSIPHKFEKLVQATEDEDARGWKMSPTTVMCIRFSPLMKPPKDKAWKPWAAEMVRLTHHGIASDHVAEDGLESIRHDLRLTLDPGTMENLRTHLIHSKDQDLAISPSGGLALRLFTPFGQPFAEQIQHQLQSVERFDGFLAILKRRHFKCTLLNLHQLTFTYNQSPELSARLTFSKDGGWPVRLKLEPVESNPHQRIRVCLEKELNNTGDSGFESFASILDFSLPVLQTLQRLEEANAAKQTLLVHPRTSMRYTLKYLSPLPAAALQLSVQKRIEGQTKLVKWHVEEVRNPAGQPRLPEDFVRALNELWQGSGEHYEGMSDGIVADAQGIGAVLERIDEVVRRFETSEVTSQDKPKDQDQSHTQPPAKTQEVTAAANTASVKSEPDVIMLD